MHFNQVMQLLISSIFFSVLEFVLFEMIHFKDFSSLQI